MAILYALISVEKTVLAEYTATSGKKIVKRNDYLRRVLLQSFQILLLVVVQHSTDEVLH